MNSNWDKASSFGNTRARSIARGRPTDANSQLLRAFQMRFLPEAVCFLELVMMTTQLPSIGSVLVILELGLLLLLVAVRPMEALQGFMRWWPLLITPLIALASMLWSDLPAMSARYAAQLLITCYLGVFLATLLPAHRFLAMTYAAMFAFCLLSIAVGAKGVSATGMVLIGLTGSKNQMAYAAFYLFAAALGCAFEKRLPRLFRLSTLVSIPIALFIIATTHAATAVLITVATALMFPILALSRRISPMGRIMTLVLVLAIVAPLPLVMTDINNFVSNFLTDVLGKDPTLTGRTHLWEIANDLISRRPLLGYGYMSIWVGDSADTLGILRWANLGDGRLFHFHNAYLQIGVDTGYVGMLSFVIFLAVILFSLLRRTVLAPANTYTFFFIVFLTMLVRSPFEILLASFQFMTVLLYAIAIYSRTPIGLKSQSAPSAAPRDDLRRGRPMSSRGLP